MNVSLMAYRLVERAANLSPLPDSIAEGIYQYVKDTGLDIALAKASSEAVASKVLETYMAPILSLPKEQLLGYFSTADLRKNFSRISNLILQEAKKKRANKSYQSRNIDSLSKTLTDITDKIKEDTVLFSLLEQEISDCNIECAFITGKTENLSLRLSRMK